VICDTIVISDVKNNISEDIFKMNEIVIGIILLVFAVFLIAAILLQSSKSHKLPGTIAGGAETFFGKTKGGKLDHILGIATTVVAIIFCILVIVMYVIQDNPFDSVPEDSSSAATATTTAASADTTTAAPADTTTAAPADTTTVAPADTMRTALP